MMRGVRQSQGVIGAKSVPGHQRQSYRSIKYASLCGARFVPAPSKDAWRSMERSRWRHGEWGERPAQVGNPGVPATERSGDLMRRLGPPPVACPGESGVRSQTRDQPAAMDGLGGRPKAQR